MTAGVLPNLIIIGAQKCGTTSLHHYLGLHPEIGMSRQKELHYFSGRHNWSRGEAWYRSWFDPAKSVDADSNTINFTAPHGFTTGEVIIYDTGLNDDDQAETAIGGLSDNKFYYAVAVDEWTLQFATDAAGNKYYAHNVCCVLVGCFRDLNPCVSNLFFRPCFRGFFRYSYFL